MSSAQRLRRWSNYVQVLYKGFVFGGLLIYDSDSHVFMVKKLYIFLYLQLIIIAYVTQL